VPKVKSSPKTIRPDFVAEAPRQSELRPGVGFSFESDSSGGTPDVRWRRLRRRLIPLNGARLYDFQAIGIQAFDALTIDRLSRLPYATDPLVSETGSDLNGHVIAMQTTNGDYVKAYIIEKNYHVSLYYVLYRKWKY
jgi:hypothetical protein